MTKRAEDSGQKGATVVEYAIGAAAIVIPLVLVVNSLRAGVTEQIDDNGTRVGTPAEVSNGVTTP